MLKPNQIICMKWNNRNKQWFIDKGYTFTQINDEFEVKAEDLTKGSHAEVVVLCDYCGKETTKKYQTYLRQHDEELGDCCPKCQNVKTRRTWQEKYGVDNVFQSETIKEKIAETCMEKYGTERACQAKEVKDKIKATCQNKYGADNYLISEQGKEEVERIFKEKYGANSPLKSEEIKEKIKATNLKKFGCEKPLQNEEVKKRREQTFMSRYGVKSYSQTQECKDKIIKTNLERYGYEHTLQVPSIRQKGMRTMLKENKIPTSSQQKEVCKLLKEMYGECSMNVPCGTCYLDCVVEINNVKFDVEYDGVYWHQDYQRDRRRDEFVKSQDYRIIRIKGAHEIPTKDQLHKAVDKLIETGNKFTHIDLV